MSFFYGNKSATVDDIWFSDSDTPIPLSALRWLVKRSQGTHKAPQQAPQGETTITSANIEKTLATVVAKAVKGNRNHIAFWLANRLIESELNATEQDGIMRRFAGYMDVDFTEQEAIATINSARRRS